MASPVVPALMDAAGISVMVLNRHLQILVANQMVLAELGGDQDDDIAGKRPGELLRCVHAWEERGGCGRSAACGRCGVLLAVLASQELEAPMERESLITAHDARGPHSLEFHVRASPLVLDDETFTVVALRDISDLKRREALERVFFHDLLNTVGGLYGWARLLQSRAGTLERPLADRICFLAQRLQTEIEDQRTLITAEEEALNLQLQPTSPLDLLTAVQTIMGDHEVAQGRSLQVDQPGPLPIVTTDPSLLLRVLVNMVKNALEATPEGGTVRMAAHGNQLTCTFTVHNDGVMAEEVAEHVFVRSFSTRSDPGRGLGTYSMKLFGERFLGGQVWFRSTAEEGTVFGITLPREGPPEVA